MKEVKKKIYYSSFIITLIVIMGKFVGIVRDALIAKNFGLTYINDVYMFSLGTTMLLISLGYGLTTTLIPIHSKILENESKEYQNTFANNIITVTLLFTIICVILGIGLASPIIKAFAPAFTENTKVFSEAKLVLRIMFISFIFMGVQSVISAINQCHKEFMESASMPIFSNILYIVYLIFFLNVFGLRGFAVTTVIGFFIMLSVNVPRYRALGYRFKLYINFKDKNLIKLSKLMLPIMFSSSLIQINLFILRAFAGRLEDGSISSVEYANKINMIVYEVFAVAINMVIYPSLASHSSSKDKKNFFETLNKGFILILLVLVPAAVGIFILRESVITVYLKRGAFGDKEVMMTSSALIYYIPSMVAYGVRELLNRAFYSLDKVKITIYNSVLNAALTLLLCKILINSLGVPGLTLANSLSVIICNLLLFYKLYSKAGNGNNKRLYNSIIKIIAASAFMGSIVYIMNRFILNIFNLSTWSSLVTLCLCAIIGVFTYIIIILFLRLDEFNFLFHSIIKKK